jgi:cell wall-associated NlpC family hydrolase
VLPNAQRIAGTFPDGSGANCFAAVMTAAGAPGAEGTWMQREPFEDWLSSCTRAGGKDADPGTVLVWRGAEGQAEHAAVALGDGWALHKPSQGWMSPTKVLRVHDVKASARCPGLRLSRRRAA